MAEYRTEHLFKAGLGGDGSSTLEFRNDAAQNMSIIDITYAHTLRDAESNEYVLIEIGKSPVLAAGVTANPFFAYAQALSAEPDTDAAKAFNGGKSWPKGKLVLEPGESLFVNIDATITTNLAIDIAYTITYEY